MTESASCRMALCLLGSLQLGNWAQERSDRGVPPVIGEAVVENLRRDHQTVRLRRQR